MIRKILYLGMFGALSGFLSSVMLYSSSSANRSFEFVVLFVPGISLGLFLSLYLRFGEEKFRKKDALYFLGFIVTLALAYFMSVLAYFLSYLFLCVFGSNGLGGMCGSYLNLNFLPMFIAGSAGTLFLILSLRMVKITFENIWIPAYAVIGGLVAYLSSIYFGDYLSSFFGSHMPLSIMGDIGDTWLYGLMIVWQACMAALLGFFSSLRGGRR